MPMIITKNAKETQALGKKLAGQMRGGEVVCLSGELGAGKTTFTQGFLEALGAKGPYTSPTFLIMKEYKKEIPISNSQFPNKSKIQNIYHIDAYRVGVKDIFNLGWEEIIANKKNVVIVEWAERIKNIIPKKAIQIKFEWAGESKRRITIIQPDLLK